MNQQTRTTIAALTITAIGLAGIYGRESFDPVARPPLPGDVPTYGYGSTQHTDGTPVKNGEVITEPEARKLAEWQVRNVYESGLKKCAPDLVLYPREMDFLVDSAYNIGTKAVCNSGMVRGFRAGDYAGGCAYILKYNFFHGKDCRIKANKCGGIPIDRQRAYKMCMGAV